MGQEPAKKHATPASDPVDRRSRQLNHNRPVPHTNQMPMKTRDMPDPLFALYISTICGSMAISHVTNDTAPIQYDAFSIGEYALPF